MEPTTYDRIVTILRRELSLKETEGVSPESNIQNDLGADSLDVVELAMCIEDEFGIDIPDEQLAPVRTVDDLVKVVDAIKTAS